MEIGFVGAGRMGRPMLVNLAAAGHDVTVYERNAGVLASLREEGVRPAGSVRDLARLPITLSMLPDGDSAVEFLLGDDGLLTAARPGHCHVLMGTVGPELVRELSAEAAKRDVRLADAPVSGSVAAASARSIVTMVGADADVYERIQPVLATMTAAQLHAGPVGSGSAVKLAVNLVIAALNQAVAEALLLGEAAGIAPAILYDALERGAANAPFVGQKRAAFLEPDRTPVAAPVALIAKDVRLALQLADSHGCRLPGTLTTAKVLEEACAAGDGGLDMAQVLRTLKTTEQGK
ncbi:NAD(P)-dependent oxidoreductase [Amycolatopsis cynarae]|uniref:NAD(P)-dependent oxidoreductase n=1 Tax=Amycolatopsis cynarae TaxID=2995223 RepID=A0ABY7BAQ3_9PSEU|nr:NAD(P)-dependent oxidoreductase [Amycolatopsis sp. HUAS 11-8]WAL67778.1 NAD(P)-dependent oxidoreductase [Amycolatopsis sp. HUAS 11-8]